MRAKFGLIVTFIFIISAAAISQEERYIQIIVSDTASLKPIQFHYQITVKEPINIYSGDTTLQPKVTSLDEVDNILGREGFTQRTRGNNYTIGEYEKENPAIVAALSSLEELGRLYSVIKPVSGATGKIVSIDYESTDTYNAELFERLFIKARTQASVLAGKTGNELGRLLNVSEVRDMWDGYYDTFKQYSKYLPADYFGGNTDFAKPYERRLQFKFELK
jgi:hypothetical protein